MYALNLSKNISRLRHKRKITQEQLASFIGVTKASVSKWENGQSIPDLTLLPQLASFFDVSVDELIGYRPQLSKEQIHKLYQEFARDFADQPFDEVIAKTQDYVKRYYSCYPFLVQICLLWLNHYMLTPDTNVQTKILTDLVELCEHIRQHCKELLVINDAVVIESIAHLQLKNPQEVIDSLEELLSPQMLLYQSNPVLIQAYTMAGKSDKADILAQFNIYNDILDLLRDATQYLLLHTDDLPICEETVKRIEQVIDTFALLKLHPNNTAAFEYQAALCYAAHGEKQKALMHLDTYVSCLLELFQSIASDQLFLHGDDYFNRIDEWFDQQNLGVYAPRSRNVVLEDCRQTLSHPAFAILEDDTAFQRLKNKLKEIK